MTFTRVCSISLLGCIAIMSTGPLAPVLAQDQRVHSIVPSSAANAPTPDYINATAKPLPIASYPDPQRDADIQNALSSKAKAPEIIPATDRSLGTGTRSPSATNVGEPVHVPVITPPQPKGFGTANLPFSTARADLFKGGDMTRPDSYYPTNELFPYRAAGKLFFVEDGQSYVCSASLIDKGLVVTAAHCVTAWGKQTDYTGWQFIPGYRNGAAPYGKWSVRQAFVLELVPHGRPEFLQYRRPWHRVQ